MTSDAERLQVSRVREIVAEDPRALAALEDAYSGRFAVMDALWWSAHPLTRAPSGALDPALALAAARAAAYSREASTSPLVAIDDPLTGESLTVTRAEAALIRLEAHLVTDSRTLIEAIERSRPQLEEAESRLEAVAPKTTTLEHAPRQGTPVAGATTAAAGSSTAGSRGIHARVASASGGGEEDSEGSDEHPGARISALAWRRRSMIWMSAAVTMTVLLLAGVVLVVAQQSGSLGTTTTAAGAAGASGATPSATAQAGASLGLTIFEDPTLAPAIPPANIDPYYKPDSLRLLGVADSDLTVYAVENRINQPCLLAVYTDGTQSATCVTKDEFASMGIELRITSLNARTSSDTYPYRSGAHDVVFWNPDGSYGVSSSPVAPTDSSSYGVNPQQTSAP
ncbi:hypothetical protein KPL76_02485 [Subtercola sp. PAMC28395]|uniref:hypothetical protein n=1 Tax=Subtercola sp. PAMC28395 TaxID=2846775 RepID=UPI001C0C6933|nr:hypothetical protein [Subtercola sp. PAMC28395]QWT24304.1 hypothetical protein KPL76_02485 [Subtercola sp. PAMC28395]